MSYINELTYFLDSGSIGVLCELILVTTCISTIILLTTKNQVISYLSSAPVFYILSVLLYQNTHILFIVIAMTFQAFVNLLIQKKISFEEMPLKNQNQENI